MVGDHNFTEAIMFMGIDFILSGLLIFNSLSFTEIDNGMKNKAVAQSMISTAAAKNVAIVYLAK